MTLAAFPTELTEDRIRVELEPLVPLDGIWSWSFLGIGIAALIGAVVWLYRRDTRELPSGISWLLLSWRLLVCAGLLIFFLQPQLRSAALLKKPSRVAILVDTSLSMGLPDGLTPEGPRRFERIVQSLGKTDWLRRLLARHDVAVYRFDESPQPTLVADFRRPAAPHPDPGQTAMRLRWPLAARVLRTLSLIVTALGGVLVVVRWLRGTERWTMEIRGWCAAMGLGLVTWGLIFLAAADLCDPQIWTQQLPSPAPPRAGPIEPEDPMALLSKISWEQELSPRGTSTRIGQALQWLVHQERGGPIAGLVLLSDGGQNAGLEVDRALAAAQLANIPIFSAGLGSPLAPCNVEIRELQAPQQVFPGDKFNLKGVVQASGLAGQPLRLRLESQSADGSSPLLLEDEIELPSVGEIYQQPFEFQVTAGELGKRTYQITAASVPGELDLRDNSRTWDVEVLDRRTVVLLIAGGPLRDFHFLRNQLYRDREIELLVWLQSAVQGADQESARLVFEFPASLEELEAIDCIVAFDPDWRRLTPEQSRNLEQWVAENAGGLLVVAGPVNTPEWTRVARNDPVIDPIRGLYPVSFFGQGSAVLKLGRFGGERPFPLEFTRTGQAADFLRLGDDESSSTRNWARFPGVFGYYAVNEAKLGADVLAHFSDPSTELDGRLPIYLATQYYGAGRVVFQASGEIWRLRTVQVEFFQQYYSRLIRWLSQGRSSRQSSRGLLLTERERYWLGEQVVVKALLRESGAAALARNDLPLTLLEPAGTASSLTLTPQPDSTGRGGSFGASFVANQAGLYRLSLAIPGGATPEILTVQIEVALPDLEKMSPQRNEPLLRRIAEESGGSYFEDLSQIESNQAPNSLENGLVPQDQSSYLPGVPNPDFHRRLMIWLLTVITAALSLEWIVRRLHRLA